MVIGRFKTVLTLRDRPLTSEEYQFLAHESSEKYGHKIAEIKGKFPSIKIKFKSSKSTIGGVVDIIAEAPSEQSQKEFDDWFKETEKTK